MSNLLEVKKIMEFSKNFHMCDVSEITENYIHLESWNVDVPKTDFDKVADLIAKDGYDISDFRLVEIPHPKVFAFWKTDETQFFDVVGDDNGDWGFSYTKNHIAYPAKSIKEAVENYDWD